MICYFFKSLIGIFFISKYLLSCQSSVLFSSKTKFYSLILRNRSNSGAVLSLNNSGFETSIEIMAISIIKADYQGSYKIKLLFSDNVERVIDFKDFLKNAKNPMTKKFLDEKLFSCYSIKYGDLIWNDYEMCFPIWDLYQQSLE
jgi:hypothetical protein